MDLVPRRSFGEVSFMGKEMNKLWKHFLAETSFPGFVSQEWSPSVDVSETKDKLLIKAELPGLDAKDISVNITGDMLTIKGEKKQEEEKKEEQYYSSERFYGSFRRSIRLPVNIKTDEVGATFKKGVLQIALPKTDEARKKEIKIKVK